MYHSSKTQQLNSGSMTLGSSSPNQQAQLNTSNLILHSSFQGAVAHYRPIAKKPPQQQYHPEKPSTILYCDHKRDLTREKGWPIESPRPCRFHLEDSVLMLLLPPLSRLSGTRACPRMILAPLCRMSRMLRAGGKLNMHSAPFEGGGEKTVKKVTASDIHL